MMDHHDEPSYPSSKSSALDELNFTHRSHWQLAPWLTGLVLSLVVFVILIPAICSACYHWYSYKRESEEENEEDEDEEHESDLDEEDYSDEEEDEENGLLNPLNKGQEDEEDPSEGSKKNIGVQVRHDDSQTPSISSSLAHSASSVPPAPPPPAQASAALVHQVSIPSDLSDRHQLREYTRTATVGEIEDPSAWLLLQNQLPIG